MLNLLHPISVQTSTKPQCKPAGSAFSAVLFSVAPGHTDMVSWQRYRKVYICWLTLEALVGDPTHFPSFNILIQAITVL